MTTNKAYIKAIAAYLPPRAVSNEELVSEFPEWTVEKIAKKVGVESRHIAAPEETISDMAVAAAERLFAEHPELDRASVDFVLLCTQSPDYFLPTTACLVQHRLGLSTHCGALDFNLGCSGYEYGLSLAGGLIAAGTAQNVLFITSEAYSKHLHPRDKGSRTIFGDAATATLIAREGWGEIATSCLGTDGSGADHLIRRSGGLKHPAPLHEVDFDEEGAIQSSDHLYMNGTEIFAFSLRIVPKLVKETLSKNGMEMGDIDLFVFHQANSFMLEHLRKKMKIASEKFIVNLAHLGNTVSSTIPLALIEAQEKGKLKGNVLLVGFGVGLSWGATLLKVRR